MKKTKSMVALVLLLTVILTACGGPKTALDATQFTDIMEKKSFQIQDATSQFEEGSAQNVTIALNENYQIEFYTLYTAQQALDTTAQNKLSFEEKKTNSYVTQTKTANNYSYYYVTTNDKIMLVACVDATMIYCTAEKTYKNDILAIVRELGYI